MNYISLLTFSLVIICISQQHQIQQSITSIDLKTQQVAQSSKDVGEQIDGVLNHSKEIFEQLKEIAASQSELREGGQTEMRRKLEAGMEMLHESYQNLGQDIERLRGEMVEIEKDIQEVSNTMSLKIENSKSILEAQEAFKSKHASMFMALDKLFKLHNAILLESCSIKAFFSYSFAFFVLSMFTSAKQTYYLRARLYLGLCATFLVEFAMCRSGQNVDQQT